MRNLAVARGLERDEGLGIAKAWFILCAHDGNPDIDGHWREWRRILPDPAMAPSLPASEVLIAGEAQGFAGWAGWMARPLPSLRGGQFRPVDHPLLYSEPHPQRCRTRLGPIRMVRVHHPESRADGRLRDEYTPSPQARCSAYMPRIRASLA